MVTEPAHITGVEPEVKNASVSNETDLSTTPTPPIIEPEMVPAEEEHHTTKFQPEFKPAQDDNDVVPEVGTPTPPTLAVEPVQTHTVEPTNEPAAGTRTWRAPQRRRTNHSRLRLQNLQRRGCYYWLSYYYYYYY